MMTKPIVMGKDTSWNIQIRAVDATYEGRVVGLHQLALLGLFRQVQNGTNQESFEVNLPPLPLQLLQELHVMAGNCVREDAYKRSKSQSKRKHI